jgi:thiamine-phosphate pyrophosphorylase
MGPTALIGFSTHNLEQALAATDEPVDYIAFGPIFQTSSKTDSESPVGLSQLTKVRGLIHTQLVAIGGITHANAETVVAAGADSLAVMSSVLAGRHEIPSRLRRLRQLLKLDIPE